MGRRECRKLPSVYLIGREARGKVCAWRIEAGSAHLSKEVPHVHLHSSEEDFDVGNSNAESADLAASLLADFLDVSPGTVEAVWKRELAEKLPESSLHEILSAERVIRLHQDVRDKLLASIRLQPNECDAVDAAQIGSFFT